MKKYRTITQRRITGHIVKTEALTLEEIENRYTTEAGWELECDCKRDAERCPKWIERAYYNGTDRVFVQRGGK